MYTSAHQYELLMTLQFSVLFLHVTSGQWIIGGCLATPAKYKALRPNEAIEKQQAFYELSVSAHSILFHFIYMTYCLCY